jgi:hypothetical protein
VLERLLQPIAADRSGSRQSVSLLLERSVADDLAPRPQISPSTSSPPKGDLCQS